MSELHRYLNHWKFFLQRHATRNTSPLSTLVVALLAGLSFTAPHGIASNYNYHRVLEIGAVSVIALWLTGSRTLSNSVCLSLDRLPSRAIGLIGLFFALGLLSALSDPTLRYSVIQILLYGLLMLSIFTVASNQITAARYCQTLLLTGLAAAAFAYELRFFVGYVTDRSSTLHLSGYDLFPGVASIRFLNQVQTWTLPFLVSAPILLRPGQRARRGAIVFLVCVWWMLVWLSSGRGTLAAMAIAGVVLAIVFRQHAADWLAIEIGTAGAGYVLYLILFGSHASQVLLHKGVGLDGRASLWLRAWELIKAHPLLGIGPMGFARQTDTIAAHPHDAVLLLASEWGVPAASLAVFLALWGLFAWIRHCQRTMDNPSHPVADRVTKLAVTASLVAAGVHSMVSGILVMPLSQLILVIVVGSALGIYQQETGISPANPPSISALRQSNRLIRACRFTAVAIVIAMAALLWPDLSHLNRRISSYQSSHPSRQLEPRFWQQGIIGGRRRP